MLTVKLPESDCLSLCLFSSPKWDLREIVASCHMYTYVYLYIGHENVYMYILSLPSFLF